MPAPRNSARKVHSEGERRREQRQRVPGEVNSTRQLKGERGPIDARIVSLRPCGDESLFLSLSFLGGLFSSFRPSSSFSSPGRVRERRGGDEKGRGRDADDVAEAASALTRLAMHSAISTTLHIFEYRLEISSSVPRKYLADSREEDRTLLDDERN